MQSDHASSHTVATILLVAITIILVALILLLCLRFFPLPEWKITTIPAIFVITNVIHVDDYTGKLNYDSRLIIIHKGTISYKNSNLKATVYRNGKPLNCVISTMNGHDFISTAHFGVQWMGGAGCSGNTWTPGEMTAIDFTDGTFHPGDSVQLDIIEKSSNQILSRHVYRVL